MKKVYSIKCNKCKKSKNPKILSIFNETLVLFIICDKCGSNNCIISKKEESIEVLKILGVIDRMNK